MYSPGKESLGILTSISVTAYGAVLHSHQYLPLFGANYIIVCVDVCKVLGCQLTFFSTAVASGIALQKEW